MDIGKTGYRIVKAFHLFFVSTWLGSWLSLLLLLMMNPGNGLPQILEAERLIHVAIVIPSVIGSLVTGIIFSGATNWGFFKHRWVIIKYGANIFPIIGGALLFLPRLNRMIDVAKNNPAAALTNPAFVSDRSGAAIFLVIQFVFVCMAIYLSVFKPRIGPQRRATTVARIDSGEEAKNITCGGTMDAGDSGGLCR